MFDVNLMLAVCFLFSSVCGLVQMVRHTYTKSKLSEANAKLSRCNRDLLSLAKRENVLSFEARKACERLKVVSDERNNWAEKADETNEELKRALNRNKHLELQTSRMSGEIDNLTGRVGACDDLRSECRRYAEQLDAAKQARDRWGKLARSLRSKSARDAATIENLKGRTPLQRTNISSASTDDVNELRNQNGSLRQRVAELVTDARNSAELRRSQRSEIARLRYQLDASQKTVISSDDLRASRDYHKRRAEEYATQVDDLTVKLSSANSEREHFKKQSADFAATVEKLRNG